MTTFKDLEHRGWTEKAQSYDAHFAEITRQAIEPIMSGFGDIGGCELLDICCGTGDLAAIAANRGARVTGIDFASTMVEIADKKVPVATFETGDAEALAFANKSFDFATCVFGLWHLADPDKALAEAARILRPQGMYAFTTWLPPQQGWDMFDILIRAIKQHGTMDVELPPAPPPFRFSDEKTAADVLGKVGFQTTSICKHEALWTGTDGGQLLDLLYKGIVRAPMLIEAQEAEARNLIKDTIRAEADAMSVDGEIKMRWPYLLAIAQLP